jgi:hypothetical protein
VVSSRVEGLLLSGVGTDDAAVVAAVVPLGSSELLLLLAVVCGHQSPFL